MMTETIIPYAHREAHQQGLERFIKTGEGQVMIKRIETTALRRDGTEFPIELAVTPLRLENAYSFTAFVVDISERKQAEEALRTSEARLMMTVQGSHIGIWDWNLTTGSIYFSPQWKSQLGHDDHTLTNAFEEWRMRIHPEDQPFVHKTIQSCLDGDQSHFEIEHQPGGSTKQGDSNRVSRGGRRLLGEKGIGRFAADKLGNALELVTRTRNAPEELRASIDWAAFENEHRMLSEVTARWERRSPAVPDRFGTSLRISGLRTTWSERLFRKLCMRLARLRSPFEAADTFRIVMHSDDFPDYSGEIVTNYLTKAPYQLEASFDGG